MDLQALAETTILFDIATGVLFALLGVFVLTLRPRRGVNLALATFAIAHGGGSALANAMSRGLLGPDAGWASVVLYCAGTVSILWFSLRWPRPLERGDGRLLVLPAALGVASFLGTVVLDGPFDLPVTTLREVASDALRSATWYFLAVLALRYARDVRAGRLANAQAAAIVSLALLLYTAGRAGLYLTQPFDQLWRLTETAVAALFTGLWLYVAARSGAEGARRARNVALVIPATALAMMVFSYATDPALAGDLGPLGLLRGIGVVVLAYAILQQQILGIDVKVRFAISKSTIAAVFIAVFFIASETAQQFLGATFQSAYFGIAAAGALVFVMAPLQRAAERLAERAVPVADPSVHRGGASNDDLYRRALRIALVDRTLTREEELTLAELSERLGIGHRRAMELRHEIDVEGPAPVAGDRP